MQILAPLSGVVVPLEGVPDPVFARRLVGDGVAIDPVSAEVLAPVAGDVTQLHAAHHAFAVTTESGVELLVHVGLDTVALKGEGFTPLVALGARVEAGQPVLRFEPDLLARRARSLVTTVLVVNAERVAGLKHAHGLVEAGRSVLLDVDVRVAAAAEHATGEWISSEPVVLPNASGLHARPAAVLAGIARRYTAAVRLVRGEQAANAKSVVAILALATRQGDALHLRAAGADAVAALQELSRALAAGCGETAGALLVAADSARSAEARPRALPVPGELRGVGASPGLAIGRVFQHRHADLDVPRTGGTEEAERRRFQDALAVAGRQLREIQAQLGDATRAQILEVHRSLLEDPDLLDPVEASLREGSSAPWAWQQAFAKHAARLEQLDNALLRERAADVRDVGRRVLALLDGKGPAHLVVPEGSILVAEELSPSDTAALDRARVLGFCTTTGGPTSHVAILARSLGIPAVVGIDEGALALADGTRAIIDGAAGCLRVSPDDAAVAQTTERIVAQDVRREADKALAFARGQTRDGHRVEVAANIRNVQEAREAVAAGAEGVGLLRSEFLFEGHQVAPTEDEQAAAYDEIARVLGPERPLVVRTLDVGGDKQLPYLPLPREDNPFLGVRGIRLSLETPELFRTQLRAILRATETGNMHVMFPMVAGLEELRAAWKLLAAERSGDPRALQVGVMVEVPAAAAMADVLAREVDFFSIGTNDLTQYTLAMDRGHPRLARHADALHPAVLRLMSMTVAGARKHGKWVGVCGGIASDPLAAPLLAGLGADELSVSVPAIGSVKAALSRWSLAECRALADEALGLSTAAEVRTLLVSRNEKAPAGGEDLRRKAV